MMTSRSDTSAPRTARERARAELTSEIKATARQHLGVSGASGVSLRAVARELGMASSAVYRYFPSRDALLTALIVDAYDSVGECAELAEEMRERDDLHGRWMAICVEVRRWAIDNPHEYALIYGSPVPGYVAPVDTTDPATRVTLLLLRLLADVAASDLFGPSPIPIPPELETDLERLSTMGGSSLDSSYMASGLAAWSQIFGMISFELFGHFNTVVTDYNAHFEYQCRVLAERLGLSTAAPTG